MVFTAEATNTGGEIFATLKVNASSVHYPLSYIVWGADSGTQNMTDTGDPFPVRLYGNNSAAPAHVTTDSGSPPLFAPRSASSADVVRIIGESGSTSITVTGAVTTSTNVTIAALSTGSKIQVEPITSSALPTFVTNNSATQLYVRADSNNPVFVRDENSTTVTVSNIAANDTTVTAILNGGQASVTVASGTITSVSSVAGVVSVEPTTSAQVSLRGFSSSVGALEVTSLALSSLAQSVMTAVGRLYGLSLSNPDTAANVFVKVFDEDSAGVTLGTTVPKINQMIPFGGGREMKWSQGLHMSSGMSIAAAGGVGSTDHTAPSTTTLVTVAFTPST